MIYFIKSENNYVKIGYTKDNPKKRLSAIQGYCPLRLEILLVIPGGFSVEKNLHSKFEKYRIHGEWFNLPKSILREIEKGVIEGMPYNNQDYIVNKLLNWKRSCNLTYYKMATFLGVSESGINRIVNGNRNCSYRLALKINSYLAKGHLSG